LRQGAGEPIVFTDYPDYREYTESARLGAVFNTAIRLNPNNKLVFRNTFTHDAEKSSREFAGFDGGVGNEIAAERLRYIERGLFSTGVEGQHSLPGWHNSLFHWQFTFSKSTRDEPDLREVFRNLLPDGRYIFAGVSTSGLRFFSALDDRIYEPQMDYSIPFFKGNVTGLFKVGIRATVRRRDFHARRFLFQLNRNTVDLFLPSNELFAAENIRPDAFQLVEQTRGTDAYDASMNIYAGYAMVDLGLGPRWRLVGGLRVEDADQTVTTRDNLSASVTPIQAVLRNTDPAPAVNAIYALTPRQNLRFSYSRTLSRPDFRELSPFDFANTLGGFITAGNPNLKRAAINNYDARWEWFAGGSQLVAVSIFAKTFTNPIERIIVPSNDLRQSFVNAKGARNFGFELELRRSLASLSRQLREFGVASNFTFVDSTVDLNPGDALIVTSQSRPLLGQSRYIGNAILEWQRPKWHSRARFNANYVSRRISDVGTFRLPDIYEEGNTFLDFVYQYTLGEKARWGIRFEAENLGNNDFRWTQGNIVQRDYHLGRTFQIGLSYSFF
jgi:TonB-dependent receptor